MIIGPVLLKGGEHTERSSTFQFGKKGGDGNK